MASERTDIRSREARQPAPEPAHRLGAEGGRWRPEGWRHDTTRLITNPSADALAQVGWEDDWQFLPVSALRIGEVVTIRVRASGLVQRNAPGAPSSSAEATGMVLRCIGFPGTTVPGENHPSDDYVDVPGFTLGSWRNVVAEMVASVVIAPGSPGPTETAEGQIQMEVVEVVDSNRLQVPIVQMCTAKGVNHRQ